MMPIPSRTRHWPGRRAALLACAGLALALTFAQPSGRLPRQTFNALVALDITQSMNTADYVLAGSPVSRLAYAKHALRQALPRLPCGSHIGWAVFTEYRVLVLIAPVEVCANFDDLAATLARIDNRMAWAGASEVAKGLYSGLRGARAIEGKPALVFVTDGHEAPPVHPGLRPRFDGEPGVTKGIIVGVGAAALSPIPKTDPDGRPLGIWAADEVAQTDVYSRGRGSSLGGETMAGAEPAQAAPPGREHLSSIKEAYLEQLALETGLGYQPLASAESMLAALTAPRLATTLDVDTDLRFVLAALALAALTLFYLPPITRGAAAKARASTS